MLLAKLGNGMLFSVEQAFVGRDETQASLKMPAWEASLPLADWQMWHFKQSPLPCKY